MQDNERDAFMDNVRRLLREIREIRQDTGYSTDQVLMAMLVEAVRELKFVPAIVVDDLLPEEPIPPEAWTEPDPNEVVTTLFHIDK